MIIMGKNENRVIFIKKVEVEITFKSSKYEASIQILSPGLKLFKAFLPRVFARSAILDHTTPTLLLSVLSFHCVQTFKYFFPVLLT